MKPSSFAESNVVYAKDQPQYLPLPAWRDERETISLWSLTWRERLRVLITGRLWLRQLNFGGPLQPQLPTTENPFRAAAAPSEGGPGKEPACQKCGATVVGGLCGSCDDLPLLPVRQPHREICSHCGEVSRVGFSVPDDVWQLSLHESQWNDIICLRCFTMLADERSVWWDFTIQFFPTSLITFRRRS